MTTTTYVPSDADRAQLPESYRKEPRYLGYRDSDAARPFAKYYRDKTEPIQAHVHDALLAGMAPAEHGYDVDDAARMLARPGYHHMETGWTRLDNGVTAIACHTDMPGVTAAMWDWWFGWLGGDSARYKLWCPEAHQFIAVGDDRSRDRSLTDRQRYVGNVSYADEYLGGVLYRLTIRFVDPTVLGIDESPDNTYIFARVGFSHLPLSFGWLIHQIRATNDGAEMRTRFFLNHPQIIDVPAQSLPSSLLAQSLTQRTARQFANAALPRIGRRLLPRNIGHDLLYHCASEMKPPGHLPARALRRIPGHTLTSHEVVAGLPLYVSVFVILLDHNIFHSASHQRVTGELGHRTEQRDQIEHISNRGRK